MSTAKASETAAPAAAKSTRMTATTTVSTSATTTVSTSATTAMRMDRTGYREPRDKQDCRGSEDMKSGLCVHDRGDGDSEEYIGMVGLVFLKSVRSTCL
jgi:hypothetical protein